MHPLGISYHSFSLNLSYEKLRGPLERRNLEESRYSDNDTDEPFSYDGEALGRMSQPESDASSTCSSEDSTCIVEVQAVERKPNKTSDNETINEGDSDENDFPPACRSPFEYLEMVSSLRETAGTRVTARTRRKARARRIARGCWIAKTRETARNGLLGSLEQWETFRMRAAQHHVPSNKVYSLRARLLLCLVGEGKFVKVEDKEGWNRKISRLFESAILELISSKEEMDEIKWDLCKQLRRKRKIILRDLVENVEDKEGWNRKISRLFESAILGLTSSKEEMDEIKWDLCKQLCRKRSKILRDLKEYDQAYSALLPVKCADYGSAGYRNDILKSDDKWIKNERSLLNKLVEKTADLRTRAMYLGNQILVKEYYSDTERLKDCLDLAELSLDLKEKYDFTSKDKQASKKIFDDAIEAAHSKIGLLDSSWLEDELFLRYTVLNTLGILQTEVSPLLAKIVAEELSVAFHRLEVESSLTKKIGLCLVAIYKKMGDTQTASEWCGETSRIYSSDFILRAQILRKQIELSLEQMDKETAKTLLDESAGLLNESEKKLESAVGLTVDLAYEYLYLADLYFMLCLRARGIRQALNVLNLVEHIMPAKERVQLYFSLLLCLKKHEEFDLAFTVTYKILQLIDYSQWNDLETVDFSKEVLENLMEYWKDSTFIPIDLRALIAVELIRLKLRDRSFKDCFEAYADLFSIRYDARIEKNYRIVLQTLSLSVVLLQREVVRESTLAGIANEMLERKRRWSRLGIHRVYELMLGSRQGIDDYRSRYVVLEAFRAYAQFQNAENNFRRALSVTDIALELLHSSDLAQAATEDDLILLRASVLLERSLALHGIQKYDDAVNDASQGLKLLERIKRSYPNSDETKASLEESKVQAAIASLELVAS